MLEDADNVGDVDPAIGTFGIQPIGLDEQLRRAAAASPEKQRGPEGPRRKLAWIS